MFTIYTIKQRLRFLPPPALSVLGYFWRFLRRSLTFFYFRAKYPTTRLLLRTRKGNGQLGQADLVDRILGGKRNGFFLDIGANHPILNNNTFFFERERGFSGVAFDPLSSYTEDWARLRPNTTFINAAVGDAPGQALFYVVKKIEGWEDQLSFVSDSYVRPDSHGCEPQTISIISIKDLMLDEVDFASIDVEGHELSVLRGMLPDVKPKVLLVENCRFPFGDGKLRNLLAANGYVFHTRIGYIDDIFVLGSV